MNVLPKKPEVVVFAGPNGSGKSTITELLNPPMDCIKPQNQKERKYGVLASKYIIQGKYET